MANTMIDDLRFVWEESVEYTNSHEYKEIEEYQNKIDDYLKVSVANDDTYLQISDLVGYLGATVESQAFHAGFKTALRLMADMHSCFEK